MSVIALPKSTAGLRDLGRLQDIPAVRQLGLLALVAATIALGLWLFFWMQKPDFVPVHAGLDAKSTGEASELLRGAQIPFRIEPGSGALAVPADQVGAARMALAQAGLPASDSSGYESLAGDQGFGTSQFVENARYQHAQEVELARTIANLRPVREARVHLALPKPSAFARRSDPASASVVLHLHNGASLEQGQVNAIVHLVASSIPELPPERVTVVDQFGRMLSSNDPDGDEAVSSRRFEQQRRQEAVYVQRIQELLEPMTGPGRVSAKVSVDMDFAQTEEARERYGPQPPQIRSEQVSESGNLVAAGAAAAASTAAAAPAARGVPGSASNTPAAAAQPAAAPAADAATAAAAAPAALSGPGSRTAVRNYELDRTLTHTRQGPGRIRRVTAAVLVDNVPAGAAVAAGKKQPTRALTANELERIQTLVQQAIGFDARRGDAVSVVNAPFARDAFEPARNEGLPLWQQPRVRELARLVFAGLALLVLILAVLRPAFRQLLSPRPRADLPVADATEAPGEDVHVSLSPAQPLQPPRAGPGTALSFEDKLEVARSAVGADPKRVARVVRDMVEADA